jgi:hypothetical protein
VPAVDQILTDPDDEPEGVDEPAVDRVPTKPLPPMRGGRIEVDLEDPEAVAAFLEMVAKIVREKRRLVILVE